MIAPIIIDQAKKEKPMSYAKLSDSEYSVLVSVASKLGVDPAWLYAEINFESGWDPQATNMQGSGARGLIQFTDLSAPDIGFLSANDIVGQFPDIASQLAGPVYDYLKRYAPFPTQQSLAMAVFYPAYRNVSPDTAFPANVQRDNPGIEKVSDYTHRVYGSALMAGVIAAASVALIIFLQNLSQKGGIV